MPDSLLALTISSILVLWIPGAALLAWMMPRMQFAVNAQRVEDQLAVDDRPDLLCWLADAAALSTALAVLVAMLMFVLRLQLPPVLIVSLYAGCALALVTAGVIRWRGRFLSMKGGLKALLALALIAALVAWRFYQARDLVLPPWVDSVHHALVVRLILENGGLPATYLPYFSGPFYYHYGFHLIAALVAFFARLSPDVSVLWFGQVVNAAVALSVYRAAYVFGDPRDPGQRTSRAYLAALLVGFALQMPAYYLTWGRFTMLTGLLLLGPTLAAAFDIWHNPRRRDAWLRLVLLIAGLGVTHYFVLLLVALFLVTLGLFGLVRWVMDGRLPAALWVLAGLTVLSLLLVSPWLARVWQFSFNLASIRVNDPLDQSPAALKRVSDYLNYLSVLLGPRRNTILLSLAGVGLLVALKRQRLRLLAIWALLLVLFSLPWGLRLGPFRPDHFAIVLFFPAGILLAELLISSAQALTILPWLRDHLTARLWVERSILLALSAALLLWGARETRDIVNSVTVIATQADIKALDWVRQNTPPDARFYTNSVLWMTNTYRGVDGGYWLEPYTGRISLVPPALYSAGPLDEIHQINDWNARGGKLQGCTADFWALVREANLTYVYAREGSGNLQPASLVDCPQLQTVYQKEGIFIYRILSSP